VIGHDCSVEEIEILAGEELIAQAPVNLDRPDVAKVHTDVPRAATSGFRVILEADDVGLGELVIQAVLADALRVRLGTVQVRVTLSLRASVVPWNFLRLIASRDRKVQWTVLSPPAEREKVLFGKDGWLFLRRDSNDVIGQQTGRVRLNRRKRRRWTQILRQRMALVERTGTVWQCLIIPDKEFLYPEYLPSNVVPVPRRPVHDILELAETINAPVGYALEDLKAAKNEAELFPKTDTHWNQRGSYTVYKSFCRSLRERGVDVPVLNESAITWLSASVPGGLGLKLYPQPVSATIFAKLPDSKSRLVFDNRVHNHGRVIVFEQEQPGGLSAVIFGESFVQNLLPFLKESFKRLVFVHTSMMVAGILEREHPDVVFSAPLERFLVQVPDDRNALVRLDKEASRKASLNRLCPEKEPFLRGIPVASTVIKPIGGVPWAVHDDQR
jgi:hypothetical protein